ncbi:MAG: hypothetical protein M0038_06685 [Pseudomonadota bacterium]|nr:hypothetical protein [Pseudomonadota bacterium]
MSTSTSCVVCGTEFTPSRRDARYCSGKCRQAALRDREKTDCSVRIGGLVAPVERFEAERTAFGEVGHATIQLATLRGVPQRDAAQRMYVELYVGDALVWAGDVTCMRRDLGSGAAEIEAEDLMGRLAELTVAAGCMQHADAYQTAAACAADAGLHYTPPQSPAHPVPLRLAAEADDVAGPASARDVLLWASRVTGERFAVLNDGTLLFGGQPAAPRAITLATGTLTMFERNAPVAAVVWSTPQLGIGNSGMLRSSRVCDVPPGVGCYHFPLHGRREVELAGIAERLGAQIARGVVQVEGETGDTQPQPHDLVLVKGVSGPLLVTRTLHRFDSGVLSLWFEATHFPPPPRVPSVIGAADSTRCAWPGSVPPAQPVEVAA